MVYLINKRLKLIKIPEKVSAKEYGEICAKRDFKKIKEKYIDK